MVFGQTPTLATGAARRALLDTIYSRFRGLEKGSKAYVELAESGRVWEEYHQPGDFAKMGYLKCQEDAVETLAQIDDVRKWMRRPASKRGAQMVPEYSHQSVMIENNTRPPGDSILMHEELHGRFFKPVNLPTLSIHELAKATPIPRLEWPKSITSKRDAFEVVELRNHLVASQWIAETALNHQGEDGLNEDEVCALSALTMRDLDESGRGLYPWTLGPRIRLGQYRQTPIGVKSNPMAVFPYHLEVPACMRRYFAWRKRMHKERVLHPLILACHAMVYFLQIHPFVDGNGRVSRLMMQDYLMRQGYLPSYIMYLDRDEYLKMIHHAADGDPSLLIDRVLTSQMEFLYSYMLDDLSSDSPRPVG
ncbi:fic [Sporothrix brasiliensis 5110]|uniref:Fic n=1 Tax=Sporothrix brasiliensis 5110 TaxID=1398154 RepID=A0A0C2FKD2_9PEZI|nr:fic [Sporothrix brasiliensis 5110]KIH91523.1 fic [Sporothrix brasiliensis 5110]